MKNIILSIMCLFAVSAAKAQDFSYLLSMTKVEAIALANKINAEVRVPWKFVEAHDSRDYLQVSFVPANTSAEDLKKVKDIGLNVSGVEHYTVQFQKFQVGEDKDLEIEGVTKYKFKSVDLKFLDGFQVWEKLFFNGTTIERVRAKEDIVIPIKEGSHRKLKFSSAYSPYWRINLLE